MAIFFEAPKGVRVQNTELTTSREQQDVSLPTFRHTDSLPELLRKGIEQFTTENEKYLFLYSTLTVSSGLFTKTHGVYGKEKVFPNLFLLVEAPPASGKSGMLYSKKLVCRIHEQVLRESQETKDIYERELKIATKTRTTPPARPPFRVALIPANCSSSKFITHLADNQTGDYPSILIESEIDTFNAAKKNEWGDFSDTLRKSFHNERVSMSRRTENEYVEVESPKIAVAFSGTMNQVKRLIDNVEDGLYSRFLVFSLEVSEEWQHVASCDGCISLSDIFEKQAEEYLKLWRYSQSRQFQVKLSDDQLRSLNDYFDQKLFETAKSTDANFQGVVKRHGVMLFKLCMVLTMFRAYEINYESSELLCTDEDYEIARYLIDKSLLSSLQVFNQLPGAKHLDIDLKKNAVFKQLPNEFTSKYATTLCSSLKISARTMERYLKYFISNALLIQPAHGKYIKVSE